MLYYAGYEGGKKVYSITFVKQLNIFEPNMLIDLQAKLYIHHTQKREWITYMYIYIFGYEAIPKR